MATNKNNHIELNLDTGSPGLNSVTFSGVYCEDDAGQPIVLTLNSVTGDPVYYKAYFTAERTATASAIIGENAWKSLTGSTISIEGITHDQDYDERAGTYQLQVVLMDNIGNQYTVPTTKMIGSYPTGTATGGMLYVDMDAPTNVSTTFVPGASISGQPANSTRTLTNSFKVTATDPGTTKQGTYQQSGVYEITISGGQVTTATKTLTTHPNSITDEVVEFSFKSGTALGTYTVYIDVQDFAGNRTQTTAPIHYDPDASNIALKLVDGDDSSTVAYSSTAAGASWINNEHLEVEAEITLDAEHGGKHDFVGYKVWVTYEGGGESTPTSWTAFPSDTGTLYSLRKFSPATLVSTADKSLPLCVHVIVQDHVGNTKTMLAWFKFYDDKGTLTLTAMDAVETDVQTVSNVSGYKSVRLRMAATRDTTGMTDVPTWNYKLKKGTNVLQQGEITSATWDYIIEDSSTVLAEGLNDITFTTEDTAGNTNSKTVKVRYDTTKPTATISSPAEQWYNTHPAVTTTINGQTHESKLEVSAWVNSTSTLGGTVPAGCTSDRTISSGTATVTFADGDVSWAGLTQGKNNYLHIKVTDPVGNTNEYVQRFWYDSVKPAAPTIAFSQSTYNGYSGSIKVTVTGLDTAGNTDSSGIAYAQFATVTTGGVQTVGGSAVGTELAFGQAGLSTDYACTFTTTDGLKGIKVRVRDNAGNWSEYSAEATTQVDTTAPVVATAVLYEKDKTTVKPAISNLDESYIKIASVSDAAVGITQLSYTITGDIEGGGPITGTIALTSGSATNVWIPTTAIKCTGENGVKTFTLVIQDTAGNKNTQTISFDYEVNDPEVYISVNGNFNTISKVHDKRKSSDGSTVVESSYYCDEIKISAHIGGNATTPSSLDADKAYEWEAHAYMTKAAATSGTHDDAQLIADTHGAAASGVASTTITVTGTNYEKALNGGTTPSTAGAVDGAHYVVVYMKDRAGNWSKSASFAA